MTKEEYYKQRRLIDQQAQKDKMTLAYEYAMSNNPYAIGDIISDHHITIKINKIKVKFAFGDDYPQCVYTGQCLRKDGKPFKKPKIDWIYQDNIKDKSKKNKEAMRETN